MKKYFLLNDRNDVSKGYTEVSEAEIRKHITNFLEGRPYFINLGYAVMETTRENYYAFYKEKRRQKYIREEAELFGEVSYNALDSAEFQGADIAYDMSEPFDKIIEQKILALKLKDYLIQLSNEEHKLIIDIYFKKISERELSRQTGIPLTTINSRKKCILKKIFKLFDK